MDVALLLWVWHGPNGCVAWPRWVMVGLNGCEIVSLGVHRVWHALSKCGMSSVCVACAQWAWLVISGCGISSVGVACPQWVCLFPK